MEQEREFVEILFAKQHWQSSLQYTELTHDKVPLGFGETNFMKVPKSMKSEKFMALEKEHPTVSKSECVPVNLIHSNRAFKINSLF